MKPHLFQEPEYGSACAYKLVQETNRPAPFDKTYDPCWRLAEDPIHLNAAGKEEEQ